MLIKEWTVFIQYSLYGWLLIALIISCITDVTQRRIPNLITIPTILFALMAYGLAAGWDGLVFSLAGLAYGFAVFLLFYLMGGMGAGDVKLMSAVGAVLGFKTAVAASLVIAICGGIMALAFMLYHRNLKHTLTNLFVGLLYMGVNKDASVLKVDNQKISQERLPYAVAIAGGVFLVFLYMLKNNQTVLSF